VEAVAAEEDEADEAEDVVVPAAAAVIGSEM
jgi:hypothetical protein